MNSDVIQKISNMTQPTEKRSPAADPSDSDQSFYSKLPETLVEDITKSAKKGDKEAQNDLGLMYYEGEGVPQDYEKAIEWYTKSAEQGHAWAQYNLGLMYYDGEGVPARL